MSFSNISLELRQLNQSGSEQPRKRDKWPHELGSKCKCEECMIKWREYWKNRRNSRNKNV